MKNLIIVRHGSSVAGILTQTGLRQVKALAEAIRSRLNGGSVLMASSTAKIAEQSSDVMATILGIPYERYEFLWTGLDSPHAALPNLGGVLDLVQSSKDDTVILVTHCECCERFPRLFGEQVLGVGDFPKSRIDWGDALVIDCESKTCTKLIPGY